MIPALLSAVLWPVAVVVSAVLAYRLSSTELAARRATDQHRGALDRAAASLADADAALAARLAVVEEVLRSEGRLAQLSGVFGRPGPKR